MAKQHTVLVLDQFEVCDALSDYIKKHYGEEMDVLTKDVYVTGYRGDRDTIDKVEVVVEEEDVESIVEDDAELDHVSPATRAINNETMRKIASATQPDIDFSALGTGKVTPRASS